jgi:hypothetical protein
VRSSDAIEMADSRTDLTLRFRLEGLTPAAADLAMAIEARAPEGRAPEARTATSGG